MAREVLLVKREVRFQQNCPLGRKEELWKWWMCKDSVSFLLSFSTCLAAGAAVLAVNCMACNGGRCSEWDHDGSIN